METTTKALLLSELYSACAYLDRILFTMERLTGPQGRQERDQLAQELARKIDQFVKLRLLPPSLGVALADERRLSGNMGPMDIARVNLAKLQSGVEAMSHFSPNVDNFARALVEMVNMLYGEAFKMHEFCVFEADVDIPYPRLNLTEMEMDEAAQDALEEMHFMEEWSESDAGSQAQNLTPFEALDGEEDPFQQGLDVARFTLPLENVLSVLREQKNLLTGLDSRRDQKYQKLLAEGHASMLQKNVEQGLARFEEALKIKETAEILTLLAWAYSLQEKNDQAKSFCLKAIQKDPDYGPPYNDLGAILLKEGQVEESLKWFELAKRSPNYHNREYPYINSGRALLCQKKYSLALDEFGKALSLAPYHKELHQTVSKLKKTLERATSGGNRPSDGAHP